MADHDRKLQAVTIGALLHDIGKFMQRAELDKRYDEITRNFGEFCPLDADGKPAYLHAAHSAYFIENIFPDGLVEKPELFNAVRHHKNPPGDLYREADCLSSGMERQKEQPPSNNRTYYKKVRLHSILEYMSIGRNVLATARYRYELKPLDASASSCFAASGDGLKPAEGESLAAQYAFLWEGFRSEFVALAADNADNFIVSLFGLLEKYTWCIPSSTMDRPDISLFDHAKTTAAIAAALHLYHCDKGDRATVRISPQDEKEKKFILLVGDISGIQNYIFNISNVGVGGTAKRLRARSFFLSALSDIAAHRLLNSFGLSLANLIISSGGKFYLLLPNTGDSRDKIDTLKTEFDDWLMSNLNAEVALNLTTTEFSCKELLSFDQVLRSVNEKLNKIKNRPYSQHLSGSDGWREERFIIDHVGFTSEESLCKGCGKFPGTLMDNEVVLCRHCDNDVTLGRELAKAVGVQFFRSPGRGKYSMLGASFSILKEGERHAADSYLVSQFNDWDFKRPGAPLKPRYFANHVPLFDSNLCRECDMKECKEQVNAKADNPKFFTCLAQASRGKKALGIFKADVDNLGLIFINGFGEHNGKSDKSISRITTLSRLLDTFFTGRLEHLLRTEFNDIYTVYAGGDDLLVLGPWNKVIEFGLKLREEFRNYCCHNPDFTLSAGIAIVKPRLPVYAAVEAADELLESAKKKESLGAHEPKDQLAVLGDRFKWKLADSLLTEADKLTVWLAEGKASMSFVRQLKESGEKYRLYKGSGETNHLRFVPMLAYSISRNIRDPVIIGWAQRFTDLREELLSNLVFLANYAIHYQEKKL